MLYEFHAAQFAGDRELGGIFNQALVHFDPAERGPLLKYGLAYAQANRLSARRFAGLSCEAVEADEGVWFQ
jgi:hypothetical protein